MTLHLNIKGYESSPLLLLIMKTLKIVQPYFFSRAKKTIQNRIVLAAMTNKQSHENGVISDDEINWLTERAKGGFGIITTAAANVSKEGKAWEGEFGVYDNYHIPNLSSLLKSCSCGNFNFFDCGCIICTTLDNVDGVVVDITPSM